VIPYSYDGYFTGAGTAAAALIGLLFVAVSLRTDSVFGPNAPPAGRALASSAFTALVNAFFVSILALIPGVNLGYGTTLLAASSLWATWKLHRYDVSRRSALVSLVLAAVAYGGELYVGIAMIVRPHDSRLVTIVVYVIIGAFGIALMRAWALLQGRHLDQQANAEQSKEWQQ
jgi:hypothetical protein